MEVKIHYKSRKMERENKSYIFSTVSALLYLSPTYRSNFKQNNKIKMGRKKQKHWFEIQAWSEGWEILSNDFKDKWYNKHPSWDDAVTYIVNDDLVEFRKAEKEGKQIQRYVIPNWVNITMDKIPPMEEGCIAGFRIKPEELKYKVGDKVITKGYSDDYDGKVLTINQIDYDMYCYFDEANNKTDNFRIIQIERFATEEEIRAASIDWSVMNDTDWFYGKMKNRIISDYLIRGLKDEDGRISFNEVYYIESGKHYKNDKFSFAKLQTEKFRLATEQEKQMVFEKYPELKPIEVGDYGVFWDDKSNHLIGYLRGVRADSTFPYSIIGGFNYKHFRRINPHKGTLAGQAPELFEGEKGNI